MMRILSILLVIAGLLAAGLGGAALLEQNVPRSTAAPAATETASMEPSAAPASAEAAAEEAAPVEIASAEPEAVQAQAAPAPAEEVAVAAGEKIAGVESAPAERALSEEETGFMFQTQMEEAPLPAEPEQRMAAPEAVAAGEPVATAASAAPSPAQSFEARLREVPVAHETPKSAEYKRPFNVTFAIDSTGDTTAADALPGRGVIEEGVAKVSDRVEVRLSGASFNIELTSPGVQSLSPLTENMWRWSVTPLTAGDHDLTFEVFAIDSETVTPLRTYRDTVTVNVSGLNRAIAFADQANPLFVLLGGLGSILAGLFGAVRFFAKR